MGFGILIFLFIIFLFVFLFAVSLGFSFLRGLFSLFGLRRRASRNSPEEEFYSTDSGRKAGRSHSKIIKEDEGEYVDYEEVK